jgi:hypothetical protein
MEWKLIRNDPPQAKDRFERKMKFTLGPMEVQYYRGRNAPMNAGRGCASLSAAAGPSRGRGLAVAASFR